MKSLLISTSDIVGGAAIAGYRLHEGLRAISRQSQMLVREKRSNDPDVIAWAQPRAASEQWLDQLSDDLRLKARTALSSTYFSLPWPGEDLASHPLVQQADVLNLHWVGHFVSPEGLRSLLVSGKPVILTLHDQRAFTGGCHYTAGSEGAVADCSNCRQLRPPFQAIASASLALSRACLEGVPAPTIVAPSRWLAGEAQRSSLFSHCRVEVIPYGLDLSVFHATDRRAARDHLGLPHEARVILFGAQNLTEPRKGFDLVQKAIEAILGEEDIKKLVDARRLVFATYGHGGDLLRATRLPLVLLGDQPSPQDMARVLSATDLFLCPSREDNLPNTVLEAMACGVPVLGANVGGIPDMITDGEHGRLVPPNDAGALAHALLDWIRNPAPSAAWGAQALAKCQQLYPLERQAHTYASLQDELMAGATAATTVVTSPAIASASLALRQACEAAAKHLADEEAARVASALEEAARRAPRDLKAELQHLEETLQQRRRNPLWLLFPSNRVLKKQREDLKAEIQKQKAERKAAKQKPAAPAEAPPPAPAPPEPSLSSEGQPVQDATLVITVSEISNRHGTGVLLERIFRDTPEFIHVRARALYGGQTAGALRICLPPGAAGQTDLPALLKGSSIKRILSIPYDRCDVENTLAFHDLTKAPLFVWLMDHNLGEGEHQIPRPTMQALLDRASLRLGISPEFCTLYAREFGYPVHFAPPVVDAALGQSSLLHLPAESFLPATGVLLGNVWSQRWLKKLVATLADAKVPMVSFGHKAPPWVKHDMLAAHAQIRGFLPEPELVAELRRHPFAVVPTGTLDAEDDLPEIARYSLPSRTLYLSAVGNLPIIVVGHADTGVARFVTRHGLGMVVPHDGKALRRAVQTICQPEQQLRFRRAAAAMAPAFACDDMLDWLWKSLEIGKPADDRWTHLQSIS